MAGGVEQLLQALAPFAQLACISPWQAQLFNGCRGRMSALPEVPMTMMRCMLRWLASWWASSATLQGGGVGQEAPFNGIIDRAAASSRQAAKSGAESC